jgi:hypothetical protein
VTLLLLLLPLLCLLPCSIWRHAHSVSVPRV